MEVEHVLQTVDEVKTFARKYGCPDTVVLEGPDYATAVVGITDDYRLIYDFDKMVEYLAITADLEYDDAVGFIEFNTIGSLPIMGRHAPVIQD